MNMFIGPTLWASKAAILTLFIRIFGTIKWLRITCYGLLLFTFLFYESIIAINAVLCIPPPGGTWNAATLKKCEHDGPSLVINGVFEVVADLIVFALPFPVIIRLNLGKKRKIGLTVVFAIGGLYVLWVPTRNLKLSAYI